MNPFALLSLFLAAGAIALGQDAPTTEQLITAMMEADRSRTAALRDYTSVRRYTLVNKRVGTRAGMTVHACYSHPGAKRFEVVEESGTAAIRKRVFRRMLDSELEAARDDLREATQITPRNYSFRLIGSEVLDGRKSFLLEAIPKTKNKYLFRGKIWVDAEDHAIARIEGAPAQNPSFWIRKTSFVHRYAKFGPFWLAASNHSDTDVLVFGRTQVRVEYSDYRINQRPSTMGL